MRNNICRRGHRAILTTTLALLAAAPASAQVKRQEILAEIQEAFKTWEAISCSNLKFEYAGEQTTFISEREGGILVYFGHDNSTWSHMSAAYHTSSDFKLIDLGDIYKATIELNARDWWWSIGKAKNQIDIRTAVLHLIPGAIGFYVGADPQHGSLKAFINLDTVIHKLDPLHEKGAQFDYPEGGSCPTVPEPAICGMAPTPTDAGAPDTGVVDAAVADAATVDAATVDAAPGDAATDVADAGPPLQLCIHHSSPNDPSKGKPLRWQKMPIKYWVFIPNRGKLPGSTDTAGGDAGPTGDGGKTGDSGPQICKTDDDCPPGYECKDAQCVPTGSGGGDDDGCCRVSYARKDSVHGAILLLLGLGLLVVLRRRS